MPRSPRDPHDDPKPSRSRAPAGPAPTIGSLIGHDPEAWVWASCSGCGYDVPMRLAEAADAFGERASSDVIRDGAVCPACGRQGVTIRLPSWEVYAEGGAGPGRFPRFYRRGAALADRGHFRFRIKKRRDQR